MDIVIQIISSRPLKVCQHSSSTARSHFHDFTITVPSLHPHCASLHQGGDLRKQAVVNDNKEDVIIVYDSNGKEMARVSTQDPEKSFMEDGTPVKEKLARGDAVHSTGKPRVEAMEEDEEEEEEEEEKPVQKRGASSKGGSKGSPEKSKKGSPAASKASKASGATAKSGKSTTKSSTTQAKKSASSGGRKRKAQEVEEEAQEEEEEEEEEAPKPKRARCVRVCVPHHGELDVFACC